MLVQDEVADRFITLLKGLSRSLVIGDQFDPATQIGPLISRDACERVLAAIADASDRQHGTLVTGGRRLQDGDLAPGYFVAPTVFADVALESGLMREEIFGPVLAIRSFATEDEAIAIGNATAHGLGAFLCTNDLGRAHRVAAALDAGTVWINGTGSLEPSMPFGGWKASGYGRLGGREGIREFTRIRNVCVALDGDGPRPHA